MPNPHYTPHRQAVDQDKYRSPAEVLRDLAAFAKVTLGSMSQTVRRLEQQEYVTKSRGTEDRRKVLFTLTDQGREASSMSRREEVAKVGPGPRSPPGPGGASEHRLHHHEGGQLGVGELR
ncbi:MarR family transcriptional regulator [Streptomyces mutabilis]|uniref:MarR family transcriptional regulator n=1 Tax=Streptomyces mutabilis TaxID=67332 RepID=UPI0037A753A6